jgi:hypothetical protein
VLVCGAESDPVYTRFTSDASAALAAPVTEVAFFTMPNGTLEDAKTTIEDALMPSIQAVTTVGKSSGGAIGWGESNPAMCSTAFLLIP